MRAQDVCPSYLVGMGGTPEVGMQQADHHKSNMSTTLLSYIDEVHHLSSWVQIIEHLVEHWMYLMQGLRLIQRQGQNMIVE